jgi:hypothetical protein
MDERVTTVLETGPRAFVSDLPKEVRDEIAQSSSLDWYKNALTLIAQEQRRQMFSDIRAIGRENRRTERKAINGLGLPYARIPFSVIELFKALYGEDCWKDADFMEDFLKHHPECKFRVKYGTRGQEYSGR